MKHSKILESIYLQTDVTSIVTFGEYVLAGIGGFLHIYSSSNNNLLRKVQIFEGQKIHGIKVDANHKLPNLVIYGGKHIRVHKINFDDYNFIDQSSSYILSDWILKTKWIEDGRKIATVFMHNKITLWNKDFEKEVSVKCAERCILYSGYICFDKYEELVVLSGTVFSEILVWKPCISENGFAPVLKRLRLHKGVIFDIHFNPNNALICSASDDRSAVLWRIENTEALKTASSHETNQFEINPICHVYGHASRVFRCRISEEFFITAGEDSLLIMWNFEGKMLRKIDSHQGGPVWSLFYDSSRDLIYSGGNDGAILKFKANPMIENKTSSLPNQDNPKFIGILSSGNMICWSEKAALYYRPEPSTSWQQISKHSDLQKYCIMESSPCKKKFALAGFNGQLYIYEEGHCKEPTLKYNHSLKNKTRIFSVQWLNCRTLIVSQKDGIVSLLFENNYKINFVQSFILPVMKERWPTCACAVGIHILMGDRKGNIHNFKIGQKNVVNSLKRSHSYLGVTKLYFTNGDIISLGRDNCLKKYQIKEDNLECIDSNKTKFSWLAALDSTRLLSFSGENFVLSEKQTSRVLFKLHCGGGHRSWDFLSNNLTFKFSFVKLKNIQTVEFNLDDFTPQQLIHGFHVREVNCLDVVPGEIPCIISGGEDTILRFSILDENLNSIKVIESLKVHLSSIRALCVCPITNDNENYFLFTAGGRAQIIFWHLKISREKKSLKTTCKEKFNLYEPLDQEDGETRIMDLCVIHRDEQMYLFAGSSDGTVKIFSVSDDFGIAFKRTISHSRHCITKMINLYLPCIEACIVSMGTDGYVRFWLVDRILVNEENPLASFKIHQSGITSCSHVITDAHLIFASGGDDNRVAVTVFSLQNNGGSAELCILSQFKDDLMHCTQVTGMFMNDKYLITCAIDQRLILSEWTFENNEFSMIVLETYHTAVADPQNLNIIEDRNTKTIYVYGNGFEILNLVS